MQTYFLSFSLSLYLSYPLPNTYTYIYLCIIHVVGQLHRVASLLIRVMHRGHTSQPSGAHVYTHFVCVYVCVCVLLFLLLLLLLNNTIPFTYTWIYGEYLHIFILIICYLEEKKNELNKIFIWRLEIYF